ncbi:BgTH12-01225 [Blumeria graminis f. sp. triticale]|uniref:BgTH12-01225 n=1 Tax=Blumeria graminis f. sp. triticale TaxID=1689686 RepID=A0A9W4D7S6_BLUGR|nr:BgTH12-01225 [Blumeria graminis f. sp. triticale]
MHIQLSNSGKIHAGFIRREFRRITYRRYHHSYVFGVTGREGSSDTVNRLIFSFSRYNRDELWDLETRTDNLRIKSDDNALGGIHLELIITKTYSFVPRYTNKLEVEHNCKSTLASTTIAVASHQGPVSEKPLEVCKCDYY